MATLQDCLTHMLHGTVDPNDISFAITTMLQECAPGPSNKHYEFLGQGALYLAITACLREQFSQYNDDILKQMLTLLTRNHSFSKAFAFYYGLHQIQLNTLLPETTAERIIGIIQDMCGSPVVLAVITPVLSEHAPQLLSALPRHLRKKMGLLSTNNNNGTPLGNGIACVPPFDTPVPEQQQFQFEPQQPPEQPISARPISIPRGYANNQNVVNPYNEFLQLTKQEGSGTSHITFEEKRNETGNIILEWSCRITFQMAKSSPWRTHSRFGQSKKKAKFLALHDINEYYKKYPQQVEQDKKVVANVGEFNENALPLPIDPQSYCHDTQQKQPSFCSSPSTPELPTEWYSPFPGCSESPAIHIPDKRGRTMEEEEEYSQHMMNVLLGNFPKISLDQDVLNKRHKKLATVSTMDITTEYNTTTTTTMMDSDDITPPPPVPSGRALLPDTIHPVSHEPISDLGGIRKIVDVSRLEKMINDPVQVANPKSSFFSYVHNLNGLSVKSEFEENGPAHQKVFEVTTIVTGGKYNVSARGMGLKKSDAEQMAILNLMKKLVGVA